MAKKSAEEMYKEYLAAGGTGALGTLAYFREVAESAAAAEAKAKDKDKRKDKRK